MSSSPKHRKRSAAKIIFIAGISLVSIILFAGVALLLYPDPFINRYIAPMITETVSKNFPAYSIRFTGISSNILNNRFRVDSLEIKAVDGSSIGTVGSLSIEGVQWFHLIFGGRLGSEDIADTEIELHNILLNGHLPNYTIRCDLLRISLPDSHIAAEAVQIHPSKTDEQFFALSKYRATRFRIGISSVNIHGIVLEPFFKGTAYNARSLRLGGLLLDVLVNKDKNDRYDTSAYDMPNDMLASLKSKLKLDKLEITAMGVKYGERFAVGGKPALITLDNMHVRGEGIANYGNDSMVVRADGLFMNSAKMSVRLSMPVASPDFSLRYSGTVGPMNVKTLNTFLEIAEGVRVSGEIRAASFGVTVISGRAGGTVRAEYTGLRFAFINKKTGSDKGLSNLLTSFIANTFTIRGSNVPDASGDMKIGAVTYTRTNEDPFFRFIWFALRSGIRDVVGF